MKTATKQNLKRDFILFLLLLACRFCFAGSPSESKAIGEWSEQSNGLRGRLVFGENEKIGGTRMGVIYLELQNVSLGDTMYAYYPAAKSPLRCELQDSAGKTIQRSGSEYDGWIPDPCWLALPNDSTLRFRVSLGGFGIPQNGGLFVAGCIEDVWVIPASATNDYYLSAILNLSAPNNETRPRIWQGTLKLPPVKISVQATAPASAAAQKPVSSDAQSVLKDLNLKAADAAWQGAIDMIERPETRPANQTDSGEVTAYISDSKRRLAKLGVTVRWNSTAKRYEVGQN